MSRSKPFDLIQMLKSLWEAHPLNQGRVYTATGRDMREAKEWIQVNAWDSGDMLDFEDRMDRFMRSDYEGWKELDYPLWAFLKHYNRYAPPRKVALTESRPQPQTMSMVIWCSRCESNHRADEECKPLRLAQ